MTSILNRIKKIKEDYPELTFENQGYQYLSKEIQEKYKDQIKEVKTLLQEYFTEDVIVEFNNFKSREDGSFCVRCQTKWDPGFTGVTYIEETDFKEELI